MKSRGFGIGIFVGYLLAVLISVTSVSRSHNVPGSTHNVLHAIDHAFGEHSDEAREVAWCESKYDPGARNGQYLGIFQMGEWERATYGNGYGPWNQAKAAFRYFVASGKDWSPWTCRFVIA